MALVLGVAAPPARAVDGKICPPGAGTIRLQAYRSPNNTDRCAHGYHTGVDSISAYNYTTNVTKCAVLKPDRNGGGGNVAGIAAGCAGLRWVATQYTFGYDGYATIINQGANLHTGFYGWIWY